MSSKKVNTQKMRKFEKELDERIGTLRSLMVPSCENVEYALDKFLGVVYDKEYQDGVKRSVELSYSITYESMQRLLTLGRRIACWDEKKLECLMKDSIPEFMRAGLDFTIKSQELYKEFSSKTLDILERTAKHCEEKSKKMETAPLRAKPEAAKTSKPA